MFRHISILQEMQYRDSFSSLIYSLIINPSKGSVLQFSAPLFSSVMVINSGYSHRSAPAQELQSRAAASVGGSITAQLVQPQGEIPEEGRKKITINKCIVLIYLDKKPTMLNQTNYLSLALHILNFKFHVI